MGLAVKKKRKVKVPRSLVGTFFFVLSCYISRLYYCTISATTPLRQYSSTRNYQYQEEINIGIRTKGSQNVSFSWAHFSQPTPPLYFYCMTEKKLGLVPQNVKMVDKSARGKTVPSM